MICQVASFLRHRKNLVDENNRHILRMQKMLARDECAAAPRLK